MSVEDTDEGVVAGAAQAEMVPSAPAPWPSGMPYTLLFPDGEGDYIAADLEHPAPLPRIGDTLEYIDERGTCHRYRVRELIHTIQSSAAQRRAVEEGSASPESVARPDDGEPAEAPGSTGLVRAGLPKVRLERAN